MSLLANQTLLERNIFGCGTLPFATMFVVLTSLVAPGAKTFGDVVIDISNDNWLARNSNSGRGNNWTWDSTRAASATITWKLGENKINGTSFAQTESSEGKFVPSDVNLVGARRTDRIPGTGSVTAAGRGNNFTYDRVFFTGYRVNWSTSVSQTGLRRDRGDTWTGNMGVNDPISINGSFLAGLGPESTYSLYLPFAILGGSSETNSAELLSGWEVDVVYGTAEGIEKLLEIDVYGDQASVRTSSLYSSTELTLLLRSGPDDLPNGISSTPGTVITTSELESLLEDDLAGDNTLNTPLYLAVMLDGIAVPTVLLGDGTVAFTGVNSLAREVAVPELGSISLATVCGLWLLSRYRQRIKYF